MARKLDKEITTEGATITFKNGESLAVRFADLSDTIREKLLQHGLSQKLGDASAGCETVEEAIAETKRVIERLIAGDWRSVREATAGPRVGLLVEALVRITGKGTEECRDVVDGIDDDKRKALRAHPQIRAAMADIRAERERAKAGEAGPSLASLFG